MTEAIERRRRGIAPRASIANDERLAPRLDEAPPAVRDAQAAAVCMIEARKALRAKVLQAQADLAAAQEHDREAANAGVAAGERPPRPTEPAAQVKVAEARRRYEAASEGAEEALDHLALVIAQNASTWKAGVFERLREKARGASEQVKAALAAWAELDAVFAVAAWLHEYDSSIVRTSSFGRAAALRDDDFDAGQVLRRMLALAERAPERAMACEPRGIPQAQESA